MNASDLNDIHVNESEVLNNVFDSGESDRDDNQVNDRFKKGEGYHAVPLPYTRNYMPPRADLSFAGLDNSVFKSKVSETITSVPKIETNASKTSKDSLEKPKTVRNTTVENENKAEKPRKFSQSPRDYQEIDGGFIAFGGNAKGGKITGKGYSINSKAFRVFNTRTRIVEENLHINFLENKPNVLGTGPKWIFDIDTLTMSMNYQPVFAWNQTNGNVGSKSSEGEVVDDTRKKSTEVLRKENEVQDPAKEGDKNDPEKDLRDQEEALRKQFEQESKRLFGQGEASKKNSTNRLNTISSPVNAVSSSFTTMDPGRERAQRNKFESMFGQDKDANGNMMFTPVSAAGSTYVNLGGSIPVNAVTLPNADLPTDHLMPDLEDTADL
nr:ribonuclease H-like domain-containing protein [Tanacetum cinerariifolium]